MRQVLRPAPVEMSLSAAGKESVTHQPPRAGLEMLRKRCPNPGAASKISNNALNNNDNTSGCNKYAKGRLTDSRCLHIWRFTGGNGRRFTRFCSSGRQLRRTPSPRYERSGGNGCPLIVVVRIFDIVGLDEGTCGRRRLLPGLQGSGLQFKIVVTFTCPDVTIRFDMCRVIDP